MATRTPTTSQTTIPLQEAMDRAAAALAAGAPDRAVALGQHMLRYYPHYLDAYRLLGEALFERAQADEAARFFRHVLAADPQNVLAHVGLALIAEDRKQLDVALAEYEWAFEIDPNIPELRGELLRLYRLHYGSAGAAIRVTPSGLAYVHLRAGLRDAAISELGAVAQQRPDRWDIEVALAEALWRNDQLDEAATVATDILAEHPACVKCCWILGYLHWISGRTESGRRYLMEAVSLDPTYRIAQALWAATPWPLNRNVARVQPALIPLASATDLAGGDMEITLTLPVFAAPADLAPGPSPGGGEESAESVEEPTTTIPALPITPAAALGAASAPELAVTARPAGPTLPVAESEVLQLMPVLAGDTDLTAPSPSDAPVEFFAESAEPAVPAPQPVEMDLAWFDDWMSEAQTPPPAPVPPLPAVLDAADLVQPDLFAAAPQPATAIPDSAAPVLDLQTAALPEAVQLELALPEPPHHLVFDPAQLPLDLPYDLSDDFLLDLLSGSLPALESTDLEVVLVAPDDFSPLVAAEPEPVVAEAGEAADEFAPMGAFDLEAVPALAIPEIALEGEATAQESLATDVAPGEADFAIGAGIVQVETESALDPAPIVAEAEETPTDPDWLPVPVQFAEDVLFADASESVITGASVPRPADLSELPPQDSAWDLSLAPVIAVAEADTGAIASADLLAGEPVDEDFGLERLDVFLGENLAQPVARLEGAGSLDSLDVYLRRDADDLAADTGAVAEPPALVAELEAAWPDPVPAVAETVAAYDLPAPGADDDLADLPVEVFSEDAMLAWLSAQSPASVIVDPAVLDPADLAALSPDEYLDWLTLPAESVATGDTAPANGTNPSHNEAVVGYNGNEPDGVPDWLRHRPSGQA